MSTPRVEATILTEGLCKRFRKRRGVMDLVRRPLAPAQRVTALEDASLEVRNGEVFGLLGPNGAGKTTLLKILCGLILPDAGRASVGGVDVAKDELAVKRTIGFVTSDERSFYWRLTGEQNLSFFARLYGVLGRERPGRVQGLLERMELMEKAKEPFSSYSSVMKQRLSLARALLHDPPVLFLDEPTRSLDPVTAAHIRTFIRRDLADTHGKTLLLATHNLHEAAALCDRMAILSRGRVRRTGRLEEFRSLLAAARAYRLVTDRPVDLRGVARLAPMEGAVSGAETAENREGDYQVRIEPEGDGDLGPLLSRLVASGARVRELTRVEPTLEEIFAHLFEEEAPPAGESPR